MSTKYNCDICSCECVEQNTYTEFVPFVLENGELRVGYRCSGEEHDHPDFSVELTIDPDKDICEKCARKITEMVCKELIKEQQ